MNKYDNAFWNALDELVTKAKLTKLMKADTDKIFVALAGNKVVGYIHINDYDVVYAPHLKNIMGIAVSAGYKSFIAVVGIRIIKCRLILKNILEAIEKERVFCYNRSYR